MLNKADRPTARPAKVENDVFDLFATLGASDDQIDYPLLYASAKHGWAQFEAPESAPAAEEEVAEPSPPSPVARTMMTPLFDSILSHVPPPAHLDRTAPFSMLIVQIENDPYVGNLYLGRISTGTLKIGDTLWALDADGKKVGEGKVKKIFSRIGLDRNECETAAAGEIVSIAGIKEGGVNISLVSPDGWDTGPKPLEVGSFILIQSIAKILHADNAHRPTDYLHHRLSQ